MIAVYLEVGKRRTFACPLDWPGWERSGRDAEAALANLADHRDRYVTALGSLGDDVPPAQFTIVERIEGDATTDFGAPGAIPETDRRPLGPDAERFATILRSAWSSLDRAAATARLPLAKGPRGGGREVESIVEHVIEAERSYGRAIGVRGTAIDATDAGAVMQRRSSLLEAALSAGPDSRWPARYFIRRTAWHALDHAWEIENRGG